MRSSGHRKRRKQASKGEHRKSGCPVRCVGAANYVLKAPYLLAMLARALWRHIAQVTSARGAALEVRRSYTTSRTRRAVCKLSPIQTAGTLQCSSAQRMLPCSLLPAAETPTSTGQSATELQLHMLCHWNISAAAGPLQAKGAALAQQALPML